MTPRVETSSECRNQHNKTRRGVRASGEPVGVAKSGVVAANFLLRAVDLPWPGLQAHTTHGPPLIHGNLALQALPAELEVSLGKILHGFNFTDRERFFQVRRDAMVQVGTAAWLAEQFAEEDTVFLTTTFAPVLWRDRSGRVVGTRPQDKTQFCQRVLRCALRKLNEGYFGRRYWKRQHLRVYEAWEHQKWGALHTHLLVGKLPTGLGPLSFGKVPRFWSYADFHEAWKAAQLGFKLTPGRAWVLPYIKGRVTDYVCKYVTKDQHGDLWSYHHGDPGEGRTTATGAGLRRRPGQSLGRFNNSKP